MPDQLNRSQQIAVNHGEGPMLVLAGPGSGKTFVITSRISSLITSRHIDPGHILVITFTREAALNMQRRFQATRNESCPVHFGTFHSCFYQILRQSGCRQAEAILNDSEKNQLMFPLIKELKTENEQKIYLEYELLQEDVRKCLSAVSYYKNTLQLDKASELLEEPYRSNFREILERYEKKRAETRKMDFDDMLYQCLKLLRERNDILKKWQNMFRYILVDEFQDINPLQYEILKLLGGNKANLFVVGDDDQSIYGFRGSRPELMMQFLKDYPSCRQVLLDQNYRSTQEIVNTSLKVIAENKKRFTKKLKAAEQNGNTDSNLQGRYPQSVSIAAFTERNEQYHTMLQEFGGMTDEMRNENAVLFRTNAMMQTFAARLLKADIPYIMKEKAKCIYDHFVMKEISCYFQIAEGALNRSNLLKIMNKPYRGISREALQDEEITFAGIRSYYRSHYNGSELTEYLIRLGGLEDGIRRIQRLPPYLAFLYLRKGMGYEDYLRKKACGDQSKLREWMELLDQAGEELKDASTKKEWLEYQMLFREKMQQKQSERKQNIHGVHLMTVHASKGLEFEQVWIPDLNEGTFPHGRLPDEETVEEERRLLYVAMTRARSSLRLTFVTGTKERPRLMSRFLNPLIQ